MSVSHTQGRPEPLQGANSKASWGKEYLPMSASHPHGSLCLSLFKSLWDSEGYACSFMPCKSGHSLQERLFQNVLVLEDWKRSCHRFLLLAIPYPSPLLEACTPLQQSLQGLCFFLISNPLPWAADGASELIGPSADPPSACTSVRPVSV